MPCVLLEAGIECYVQLRQTSVVKDPKIQSSLYEKKIQFILNSAS